MALDLLVPTPEPSLSPLATTQRPGGWSAARPVAALGDTNACILAASSSYCPSRSSPALPTDAVRWLPYLFPRRLLLHMVYGDYKTPTGRVINELRH